MFDKDPIEVNVAHVAAIIAVLAAVCLAGFAIYINSAALAWALGLGGVVATGTASVILVGMVYYALILKVNSFSLLPLRARGAILAANQVVVLFWVVTLNPLNWFASIAACLIAVFALYYGLRVLVTGQESA